MSDVQVAENDYLDLEQITHVAELTLQELKRGSEFKGRFIRKMKSAMDIRSNAALTAFDRGHMSQLLVDLVCDEGVTTVWNSAQSLELMPLYESILLFRELKSAALQWGIDPSRIDMSIRICSLYMQIVSTALAHLRRRTISRLTYGEYRETYEWHRIRQRKLLQQKNKCATCNTVHPLEVHHKTYERLGDEWDDDLVVLCRDCHKKYHNLYPDPPEGIIGDLWK